MTMRCGNCGQYGIRWMGPLSNLTHTECPHCGGTNCQDPDEAILQDIFDKMAEVVAPLPGEE